MAAPRPNTAVTRRDNPLARWIKALSILAVIALMCFFGVRLLSKKVRDFTPDELKARMEQSAEAAPLPLDTVIEQVNRLDVDTRRDVMQSKEAQHYFNTLKPEQRLKFVRETMDRGIRNQIERYRKMNPEEKKAFIEEAKARQQEVRERLQNQSPEEREKTQTAMNAGNMYEVIERVMQTYLSVTSSEERAELAPLYDGALENLKVAKGQ